jgi:GxxExxY protein
LIIEIKAATNLAPEHELQLINYLAATGIDHGLLINFGEESTFDVKFESINPG